MNKMENSSNHILILNADLVDLAEYQSIFSQSGYEVSCFHDPIIAFEKMNSGMFDIALIDYHTPDTNEYQFLTQLEGLVPSMRIHIIYLSTLNHEVFYKNCSIKGVYYIQKPVSSNELMIRVEVWLKQRDRLYQLERENRKNEKIIQENQKEIDNLKNMLQMVEQFKQKTNTPMKKIDRISSHLQILKQKSIPINERNTIIQKIERELNLIRSKTKSDIHYYNLTKTELKVATMIKDGFSTKEIADKMEKSTSTIETHRKNIRKKIGIKNKNFNLTDYLKKIVLH